MLVVSRESSRGMELTQAAQEQRWVGLGELEGHGSELRDQEPGRAAMEGRREKLSVGG